MVLPPFKTEQYQKIISAIVLMLGLIFLISESLWTLSVFGLRINMFIGGVLLMFFGLLYLFDVV